MLIEIDLTSQTPLYQQIRDQVVLGVATSKLSPGELLPTVRQLADDLGINPMTVNKAYTQLKHEGFIVADRRQGTRVRADQDPAGFASDYKERLVVILAEGLAKAKDRKVFKQKVLGLMDEIGGKS